MKHRRKKMRTAKTEVLRLSRNFDQCSSQVNGVTLKQVEKFKNFGLAFTSDEKQDEELDTGNKQGLCSNDSFALFGCHETRIVEKGKAINFQNSFCLHSHLWT